MNENGSNALQTWACARPQLMEPGKALPCRQDARELRMKSHMYYSIYHCWLLCCCLFSEPGVVAFPRILQKRASELGMRQYGEVMGQLEKYTALRGAAVREKQRSLREPIRAGEPAGH